MRANTCISVVWVAKKKNLDLSTRFFQTCYSKHNFFSFFSLTIMKLILIFFKTMPFSWLCTCKPKTIIEVSRQHNLTPCSSQGQISRFFLFGNLLCKNFTNITIIGPRPVLLLNLEHVTMNEPLNHWSVYQINLTEAIAREILNLSTSRKTDFSSEWTRKAHLSLHFSYMSLVTRKPVFGVCDKGWLKQAGLARGLKFQI